MKSPTQNSPTALVGLALLALLSATIIAPAVATAAEKPNVIFILCDDLGWGDLGVFHQNNSKRSKKFTTPHLDAMARGGVQLRNHYCPAPVCAPSRASLLLGVHQGNCEIRDNQFDKELPDNHTLATMMQTAGYSTAIIGKYGLQGNETLKREDKGSVAQWPGYPTRRGFDEFFGSVRHVDGHLHYPAHAWSLGNSESHRTPKEFWHNENEISSQLAKCYTTDLFTAYAKHWIAEQTQRDQKPFFLYLAYDTPHAALQVPSTAYPSGLGIHGGVQWIGDDGHMINTAQGEIDSYRYDEHTGRGWSDVEERFATMVRRIDDCVGDLLQTLKDLGIDENTLVVLSSDNGPHHESYLASSEYAPTSFQSYGPFDGNKRDTWEGGIRVPTLAWWPTRIPAGTMDPSPSQFHDWMATMAEIAGTSPPAICDGVSLVPTMTKTGDRDSSTVYVEYAQNGRTQDYPDFEPRKRKSPRKQMQVLMSGNYKGIRLDIRKPQDPFEIYDLDTDPGETKNLAGTSDAMDQLQQSIQDRVLRLRRSNPSAKRPYDQAPMPALPETPTRPGILVKSIEGEFPYVPQFESIPPNEQVLTIARDPVVFMENLTSSQLAGAYQFRGHLTMPSTGSYEFVFQSSTSAVVRIHEAVLFDHDFRHQPDTPIQTTIDLETGQHPFVITILGGNTPPQWTLKGHATQTPGHEVAVGAWRIADTR